MFIVFEGIDGCGKDTQIELLKKDYEFKHFKYPTRKFSILREYLDGKISLDRKSSFLLFLADIADEQKKLAEAELAFVDRYVYSTIAYELDEFGFEKSVKMVEDIGFLKPDLVILLDISAKTAQKRKTGQKELDRYEGNLEYLEKVRGKFLKLAEQSFHSGWIVIDAGGSVDEVNAKIKDALSKIL